MIRIGFDVDGVLADFSTGYEKIVREVTGRDLFPKRDDLDPPVWNWPEHYGYTEEEIGKVWHAIKESPDFWLNLQSFHENMEALINFYEEHGEYAEVYFVTARPGFKTKQQTEFWLENYLREPVTVLISDRKGLVAEALQLDVYIDDKPENIHDVLQRSPLTRVYILDRAYNRKFHDPRAVRVRSLREMFEREDLLRRKVA